MNKWPEQPRALISYAYIKPDDRLPADFDLLIDSGAYTAHTKGKEVDLGTYMQFLADRAGQYRAAFSLDVIGDPAASMRNYRIMRRNLPDEIRLIPTWHVGSGWDEYRAVIDSGAPLVGIGGAVAHSSRQNALMRTFVAAHRLAADAGVRLHGLGQTSLQAMRLPWESVDSSSWTYPLRYPMLLLARRDGGIRSMTRGKPLTVAERHLVRTYGMDPRRVSSPTRASPALLADSAVQTGRSYIYTEQAGRHGTRVYLAYAGADYIADYLRAAYRAGSPYPTKENPQ